MRPTTILAAVLALQLLFAGCVFDTPSGGGPSDSTNATDDGNATSNAAALQSSAVAGTYACLSFNVNSAGGSCSTQPRLYLHAEGTYIFSSSSGKFSRPAADKVSFEGGLASRGLATYTADKQIRWQFDQDGASYTITYYLQSAAADAGDETELTPDNWSGPVPDDVPGSYYCHFMDGGRCYQEVPIDLRANATWDGPGGHGRFTLDGPTITFWRQSGDGSWYRGGSSAAGTTGTIANGTITFNETRWVKQ